MNGGLFGMPQAPMPARAQYGGAGLQGGLLGFSPYAAPLPIRSVENISAPPTDAELTAIFGAANNGFRAIIDDAGGGSSYYLVERSGGVWLYVALTKAV